MPKNNTATDHNTAFWLLYNSVKTVAKQAGLKLSHRDNHRLANAYQAHLTGDTELPGHDPKTYSDPTGEAAVRSWLTRWLTEGMGAAA